MHAETRHTKVLLGVAALALLVGGTLWYPAVSDIQQLRAEIASANQELLGTRGQTAGLSDLAREVNAMHAELRSSRRAIPNEGELAGLIRGLTAQVADLQLTEPNISTRPTVEGEGYVTMPIEVSFRGDSRAAFAYINRLENMPRLVQVTGLRVNSDRDNSRVDAHVELKTFYYAAREEGR